MIEIPMIDLKQKINPYSVIIQRYWCCNSNSKRFQYRLYAAPPMPPFYILRPRLYYSLFRSLDFNFTENTPGMIRKMRAKIIF